MDNEIFEFISKFNLSTLNEYFETQKKKIGYIGNLVFVYSNQYKKLQVTKVNKTLLKSDFLL